MQEADSVNTTTRRTFLSTAAVAIPAIAAAPMTALAATETDPVFAGIAEYRAAQLVETAAVSDHCRRENRMYELGLSNPLIAVRDRRHTDRGQNCIVSSGEEIDKLVPPDRFPEQNARYHAMFDPLRREHDEIMGDSKNIMCEAQDVASAALYDAVSTVPTTMAGVMALLEIIDELNERNGVAMDSDVLSSTLASVQDALGNLICAGGTPA